MIRLLRGLFRRRKPLTLEQRLTEYNRKRNEYLEQLRRGDPLP
jgi:hypothetical protein